MRTYDELLAENDRLRAELEEATETIHAIYTGQVDALVVEGQGGHELYTLETADLTYRVIIETMNEGAVTLGRDGLIVYCNSTFATLVGLPLSQVIGFSFYQFVTADCQERCQLLLADEQTAKRKGELMLTGQTGTPIPCLLSMTKLDLDEGASLSIIVTDLTVQKQTQQLLKANNEQLKKTNVALAVSNNALNLSNDNLQQFAYVASHDLQEPLRKIQSFGNLLQTTYSAQLGDDGVDMIRRMEAASTRMSLLIRDLLNYSRLTTQLAPSQSVNLNELIRDVLDDLSFAVTESNAQVVCADLPTVQGDERQFQQLFQNLIANALKFRRHAVTPTVRITARQIPATAIPPQAMAMVLTETPDRLFHEINVTDNGIGFDEKYTDRIFQVFQRLHAKSQYPGSGVGLAICRKVVFNHQGGLTARSQQGEGTTFLVYLPA